MKNKMAQAKLDEFAAKGGRFIPMLFGYLPVVDKKGKLQQGTTPPLKALETLDKFSMDAAKQAYENTQRANQPIDIARKQLAVGERQLDELEELNENFGGVEGV